MTSFWKQTVQDKKVILFDLDATLVDSFEDISLSVNMVLEELQLTKISPQEIHEYIGIGAKHLLKKSLEAAGGPELFDKARELFVQFYSENLTKNSRLYPCAIEILEMAKQHHCQLAICSNKPEAFALELLKQLHILDFFSWVLGGDSLPEKKPSAFPLLYLLEKSKVTASQALMIGDSIYDIQAAKNANIDSIGITTGNHTQKELLAEGAKKVFSSLQEMLEASP